jgi:hypothetical protein
VVSAMARAKREGVTGEDFLDSLKLKIPELDE